MSALLGGGQLNTFQLNGATDTTPPALAPVVDPGVHYITFRRVGNTFLTLGLHGLPVNGDSWKIYQDGVLIASNIAGDYDYNITGLTPDTEYVYTLKASNSVGDSAFTSPDAVETSLVAGGLNVPATPAVPAVEKSCVPAVFTITDSGWIESENAPTFTSGLRRRINGVIEVLAPGWDGAGGVFDDGDVEAFDSLEYSVNRSNSAGDSAWSAWSAAIALESSTVLTIVSPATGTISGTKHIRLSASTAITTPVLKWNGVPIGTPTLESGFYVFDWDTFDSSQGAGVLRFQAIGADGCPAKAEVAFTLNNSVAGLSVYADVICREGVAKTGERLKSAAFRFEAAPLPDSPRLRYFLRANVYLDDLAHDAAFALAFDETTWTTGQPLLLEQGRVLADGTTQYKWFDLLSHPTGVGNRAIFRVRWDAAEVTLGYSTFGEGSGSRIVKMRADGERVLLLARKDDNSAARIYSFDGSELELLYDLGDYAGPGAFDFALAADKMFVAEAGDFFYIDTTSGEANGATSPRGETRVLSFIESIDGLLLAIYADNAQTPKTKCYSWDGSWKQVWTLAELPTSVSIEDDTLLVGAGTKLYSSANGTATPVLENTFAASITAPGMTFTGLTNGKLFELANDEWIERLDRAGAITAIAEYSGATNETDNPRGVAGEATTTLLEASLDPAIWDDGRVLSTPALMTETISGVTALHRFLTETAPAIGDFGQPGYVAATYRELLLVGTSPDGALLTIEASTIAADALAVEARKIAAIHAKAISEEIV